MENKDIDITAEDNQSITIITHNGYLITIYTGNYTDKNINIEVKKIDYHDWS